MDHPELWLLVWALTVVLNIVPAFMPPTWTLLVFFRVRYDLDVWPLALVGALGAATGRLLLALLSRAFGERIVPARWRANILALADTIQSRPALARFISYAFWVSVGTTAAQSLRDVLSPRLGNQIAIGMQLLGFVALIVVMQVDWAARLKHWRMSQNTSQRS